MGMIKLTDSDGTIKWQTHYNEVTTDYKNRKVPNAIFPDLQYKEVLFLIGKVRGQAAVIKFFKSTS